MTVAQNLAISFDLDLDPISPAVMARVTGLPQKSGSTRLILETRVSARRRSLRAQVYLARALALDPAVLVLEHPTANLAPDEAQSSRRS